MQLSVAFLCHDHSACLTCSVVLPKLRDTGQFGSPSRFFGTFRRSKKDIRTTIWQTQRKFITPLLGREDQGAGNGEGQMSTEIYHINRTVARESCCYCEKEGMSATSSWRLGRMRLTNRFVCCCLQSTALDTHIAIKEASGRETAPMATEAAARYEQFAEYEMRVSRYTRLKGANGWLC